MGACCGSEKVSPDGEEKGEKFQVGGKHDLSKGPVSERGCTDILCLLIFILHWVLYVIVSFAGAADGNPSKLIAPRDSFGMYCGIETQWDGYPAKIGADLSGHPSMIYTLNVTSTIDTIANTFLCSNSVKNELVSNAGVTEDQYSAACSSVGNLNLDQAAAYVSDKVSEYTDPSKVVNLLTGSGGTSILSEVTKYFYSACVSSCDVDTSNVPRKYTYMPAPDNNIYPIWTKLVDHVPSAPQALQTAFAQFEFNALSKDECPYADAKMCIPLPDIKFVDVYNGHCSFEVSGGAASALSDAATSALNTMADSSIAQDASSGLDSAVGDIQSTWDVFIIVAVISFVVGLVFLVLLRFTVGAIVWTAIGLVLFFFVIGGALSLMYSNLCADDSLSDSLTAANINATMTGSSDCQLYEVEDESARDALFYIGIILLIAGLAWAILVLCLCYKIRLAIAINKVGAQFIYCTPHIIFLPIVQICISIVYCAIWMLLASFLLSQVPSGYVPDKCFNTYADAMGTSDTPGECNSAWPSGSAYKADADDECIASGCCWRCSPPRYMFDVRFAFSFFSFLWNNAFLVACGQCIIAGACGIWFFNQSKGGGFALCAWCGKEESEDAKSARSASRLSVCSSLSNTVSYHLGTMAFGSFILAVVQFLKYFMKWLQKQAEAQKNKVMAFICKVLGYCLWCFEKCIKFLNKNAYIQTALMGTSFCTSAKNAFYLIIRNAVRMSLLGGLGSIINIIGKYFIATASAVCGFFLLQAMYPDLQQPYVLVFLYFIIGYLTGSLFMNVFALAVDTSLQCFVATEEMGIDKEFIPAVLRKFVEDPKEDNGCCGCC